MHEFFWLTVRDISFPVGRPSGGKSRYTCQWLLAWLASFQWPWLPTANGYLTQIKRLTQLQSQALLITMTTPMRMRSR